ncbi:MAG TPA: hypothetical protein VFE41_16395 [Acetobacteraceae bacterium]|jgi:hypothetical protein|nr:hypothetical protein [Acetobacteraceae bacterium]
MLVSPGSDQFILSAFDRDQWCPVLQTRFWPNNLGALRSILGEQASGDPELQRWYLLDGRDLAAVVKRFGVAFDPEPLQCKEPDIFLFRKRRMSGTPYLVHTGYELPLLLEGRKKLARMSHDYPPATFEGEDQFDHWVSAGLLHREEVIEPFDQPIKGWLRHRTTYYTPKGEEWRIPAMQLLSRASGRSGGWNEYYERLEGMLFGYADSENDWWVNVGFRAEVLAAPRYAVQSAPKG